MFSYRATCRRFCFAAIAFLAAGVWPDVAPAQSPAVERPLEDFLVRAKVREVLLSPSGDQIAYLERHENSSSLWQWHLASDVRNKLLESRLIESLYFSSDGEGLFIETVDRIGYLDLETHHARWIFSFEDHDEPRFLGVDPVVSPAVLVVDKIEDDGPDQSGSETEIYRLLRIDPQGNVETVYESDQLARQFLLDPDGELRYLKRADGLEQVILRRTGGQWREVLRCDMLDSCLPVAFQPLQTSADADRLWLMGRGEGDLRSLFSVTVQTQGAGELEISTPRLEHIDPEKLADLRSVAFGVTGPNQGRPILASHDSDRRRVYGLVPEAERAMAELRRRLPRARLSETRLRIEVSDGAWLVEESGARLQHPRYHLFDPETGHLQEVLHEERASVESIAEADLVEPEFHTFTASDGLPVHGLVYVPHLPDGQSAASLPVILRIHGGPWNHVRRRWSSLSQFLVSRGYIVYEPNFRASTGFGRQHITAANGDFGDGRVQLDMLEGLDDLHARGLGDPEQVAILGHSFGGFSTLGGLAFTPRRFVAGVASAPPIDLGRAVRDMPEDMLQHNNIARPAVLKELVGDLDDPAVAADLRRRSPEYHLANTQRPLLMLAGGADPKVDIVDVRHYAGALRGLGKDVSFLVDDQQGHSFENDVSLGTYFFLVERFLGHHLGGRVVPSTDPRIEPYLETHLRFAGPSLKAALSAPY